MKDSAYEALRDHAAWFERPGLGFIRALGEDRARLLHAMCTNHVQGLAVGQGCYAFFLNDKGRILADAHIYHYPDYHLVTTGADTVQRIYEHLERYIIADDVSLENETARRTAFAIEGPTAGQVVASWALEPEVMLLNENYTGIGVTVSVPVEQRDEWRSRLSASGMPEASSEQMEIVRVERGIPAYGQDFSDANLPQETGLMQALHFAKGCYLGQEIVERIRSRGHVNRQLVRLAARQRVNRGDRILADGKEAGEITSAVWSPANNEARAIGMLRTEARQALRLEAGGVELRLLD